MSGVYEERASRADAEIDRLAQYLMTHWPRHIQEGSAVDNAIRILEEIREGGLIRAAESRRQEHLSGPSTK